MKFIFKWLLRLLFAAIALAIIGTVIVLLTYNSVLRNAIQHEVQSRTGMDAEIGSLKVALLSPTVKIQNAKIANPPEFGGAPFLDISEIYIDYDRAAFAKKAVHIKLAKINLAELDIVKNQNGQTNIFAFVKSPRARNDKSAAPAKFDFKKQTGYDFQGIDELNVSLGRLKFIDLSNPQNNREQTIGIESFVIPNVKTGKDLAGLWTMIYLRSDGFFDSILGPKKSNPLQDYLKSAGLSF